MELISVSLEKTSIHQYSQLTDQIEIQSNYRSTSTVLLHSAASFGVRCTAKVVPHPHPERDTHRLVGGVGTGNFLKLEYFLRLRGVGWTGLERGEMLYSSVLLIDLVLLHH